MLPVVLAGMPISSRGIPSRAVSINIPRATSSLLASVMAIASASADDNAGTSCLLLKHFKQHPRQEITAPDTLVTFHEASQKPTTTPSSVNRVVNWRASAAQNANDPSTNEESYEDKPPRGHGASTETTQKPNRKSKVCPGECCPCKLSQDSTVALGFRGGQFGRPEPFLCIFKQLLQFGHSRTSGFFELLFPRHEDSLHVASRHSKIQTLLGIVEPVDCAA